MPLQTHKQDMVWSIWPSFNVDLKHLVLRGILLLNMEVSRCALREISLGTENLMSFLVRVVSWQSV